MKMQVLAQMGAVALSAMISSSAFAHGFSDDNDHAKCETVQVSRSVSGPVDYHTTYAGISATNVTIQNFYLRTEEGQVIKVQSDPVEVNLQDLSGFAKGLQLHLSQVNFPDNADSINVAEIDVDVVKGSSYMVSGDLNKCQFENSPGRLIFYTDQAIALGHDDYHVKVNFTALNAIQLNVVTTVTQNKCCKSSCHTSWNWKSAWNAHSSDKNCTLGAEQTSTETKCRLVNRRHEVTSIVRAVDDNF